MPLRYNFNDIFYTYPDLGIIIPRYTIVINNSVAPQGQAINRNILIGGLNLFNYIGHDLSGIWHDEIRQLEILNFY